MTIVDGRRGPRRELNSVVRAWAGRLLGRGRASPIVRHAAGAARSGDWVPERAAIVARTRTDGEAIQRAGAAGLHQARILTLQDTYSQGAELVNYYIDRGYYDRIVVCDRIALFEDSWTFQLLRELNNRLTPRGDLWVPASGRSARACGISVAWLVEALELDRESVSFRDGLAVVPKSHCGPPEEIDSQNALSDRIADVYRADDWKPVLCYLAVKRNGRRVLEDAPDLSENLEKIVLEDLHEVFPEDLPIGVSTRDLPVVREVAEKEGLLAAEGEARIGLEGRARRLGKLWDAARQATWSERCERERKRLAAFTNRYGMLRQKSPALKHVLRRMLPNDGGRRKIVEIGGSTANMTSELMLDRSTGVARASIVEPRVEHLVKFRRLARLLPEQIVANTGFQLCTAQHGDYEGADVVLAIGTLLLLPREELAALLERVWSGLQGVGLLIVHENMAVGEGKDGGSFNHLRFTPRELDSYLGRLGRVRYFAVTAEMELKRRQVGNRTVYRVVQKGAW